MFYVIIFYPHTFKYEESWQKKPLVVFTTQFIVIHPLDLGMVL
jgi:hypothetical protein